jgi:hypothetical protein
MHDAMITLLTEWMVLKRLMSGVSTAAIAEMNAQGACET